ncbi:fluoride efflux transporter CrcB [Acinetobacter sp. ANC 4216]|uniref:fluoride efflux transporter CrcB n=1 Tax=unclassified Acinetobacter TaxID=196816 RepID=UPI00104026E3|nr:MULTISPECIES: fluoride efflux transporter CrcB [unclassified Acinetobacter]MCT8090061.1 fluoride efflux transporter CrcB [Acinetobacter sp. F_3_1]MCT8098452.1 fluoride efflux transporter CrcB [Acinetobacter sp. C_3_1]MCT8101520.1 fluoride efflux transporter CrcB [Acinetobacter sp. C_4_1]MCT8135503.1 fluoride efflux transporter CrcB [Acinetobacter sp. T_3_1]TCB72005.1 fluoride efflux transporter CrcB [Acinetobacter sp. ANC 4216]
MNWLLVALGGAVGASLRYGAGILLFKPTSGFPWTTWWVNIFGCLLAGIFFAYSQKFPVLQNEARLFLMVGILGGFTTFSSFGLETFQLLKHGQTTLALGYMISSVMMGILVLTLGFYLFQWLLHSR